VPGCWERVEPGQAQHVAHGLVPAGADPDRAGTLGDRAGPLLEEVDLPRRRHGAARAVAAVSWSGRGASG